MENFVELSYTYFTVFVLKYVVGGGEGHIISSLASNGNLAIINSV